MGRVQKIGGKISTRMIEGLLPANSGPSRYLERKWVGTRYWGLIMSFGKWVVFVLVLTAGSAGAVGNAARSSPEGVFMLSAVDMLVAGDTFSDVAIEQATHISLRIDQKHPNTPTDIGDSDDDAGLFKHVEYDRQVDPSPTRKGIIRIEINQKHCLSGSTIVEHYRKDYGLPRFDPPSPHGGLLQPNYINYSVKDKTATLMFRFEHDEQCAQGIIINGNL